MGGVLVYELDSLSLIHENNLRAPIFRKVIRTGNPTKLSVSIAIESSPRMDVFGAWKPTDTSPSMPPHVLRRVKAQIHDAVLFSVPRENWEACRDYLVRLMETEFQPSVGGQRVEFPVSAVHSHPIWGMR